MTERNVSPATSTDEPEAPKVAALDESKESPELTDADTSEELTEADTATELTDTDEPDAELSDADDADLAATEPEVTTTAGRRSGWVRVAAGLLALLLIASAGLTAWLYFHTYRPDQQTGTIASDAALEAAKAGTVAALTYSPESLDKDLETAKSHLTGDFLNYYGQFTDSVVRPAVKTKQVTTSANVVRAAVSEMHPNQAKVLVFVNQQTISADRQEPTLSASSVVVTMDKVDGKWLISAFDPV